VDNIWNLDGTGEIYGTGSSYLLLYGTGKFNTVPEREDPLVAEM
jgi:hypothetical protein